MEKNLNQTVFKKVKKEVKYAQISNELINNRNLSYKALGIITYILSKPDDWEVYISDLMRDGKDGEKSVRSGIKELVENKYMQRYRVYDAETKKVNHWETLVSEEPFEDSELISSVKETYLRDNEGKIIYQKIKFGNFERLTPIVINREVELLSQKVKVAKVKVEKEGQQILINTKTDLNKNLISSSSSESMDKELIELFENNICELKKTTKAKFKECCNEFNSDLIIAVLEYAATTGIKSYQGFETIIERTVIPQNITTSEEFIKSVEEYRNKRNEKKKAAAQKIKATETTKEKTLRFNNFEAREYDYDELENKLLGWDKE